MKIEDKDEMSVKFSDRSNQNDTKKSKKKTNIEKNLKIHL